MAIWAIAATNAVELAANAPASIPRLKRIVQFAPRLAQFRFGLQNAFKNTIAPAKAVPVLVNFQVQQNGSAIRVVDADGSVYDGSLLPESAVAQNEPAPAATPAPPVTRAAQVERAKINRQPG